MRHVNPASSSGDQNLVACQYKTDIYFYTVKPVQKGQELLVWYCKEFAQRLEQPVSGEADSSKYSVSTDIYSNLQMLSNRTEFSVDFIANLIPVMEENPCIKYKCRSKHFQGITMWPMPYKIPYVVQNGLKQWSKHVKPVTMRIGQFIMSLYHRGPHYALSLYCQLVYYIL